MSLAEVFGAMHALTVRGDAARAGTRLYGAPSEDRRVDRARLSVYARAYRENVLSCSEVLFPVTRRVFVARFGEPAWRALHAELGRSAPMPEIRFGTASLVSALAAPESIARGVPRWLSELAALELVERRVYFSPDVAPREGLHVAEPHAVRVYAHQVFFVRVAADPSALEPAQKKQVVATWRTEGGEMRSMPMTATSLRVLLAVEAGGRASLDALAESETSANEARIHATVATLLEREFLRR